MTDLDLDPVSSDLLLALGTALDGNPPPTGAIRRARGPAGRVNVAMALVAFCGKGAANP
jgi:hypothetical protein